MPNKKAPVRISRVNKNTDERLEIITAATCLMREEFVQLRVRSISEEVCTICQERLR